ncbi:hypothetical protein [Methanobrevibacter sp.]|uniref:hypothetical protein n=1 Tax=Methanobrevibacter sp. TaxID=66852 RepID=UPI0025EAB0E2|nr:hypothetical protein [Methanobrevibacter sp.]MBQ2961416.1 hypothetical protein [Methanobrevibacter sp.]
MTNSKNSNLEDVSKGNDESAPGAKDSTSNKETRFTKSKSISEVFKELEFEDDESYETSNDFEDDVDEIIPIHNEYRDLEESDAFDDESIEGGVILNPDLDDSTEANVSESAGADLKENTDSIDEAEDDFSDSFDDEIDSDEDSFVAPKDSDIVLADEDVEEKIGKSSAQGVLINDKNKSPAIPERSFDIFDSSTLLTIAGFIAGLAILIIGISYYFSSSDRVVDNVLSGETAGLAIFLIIIGLIIIGFSLLKFFSSSKSSLIIDTFNSIKSIDYDEISEDGLTREDFDAIFGMFKRNKDSNFSDDGDDDKSVDSSKDLFEKESEEKLSEEEINSLYSDSNLRSQKNQTSFKEHENADSAELSDDNDDEVDEIIPIHSRLNKQSEGSDLEDKYSKYDFDEDDEEEFDLVSVDEEDIPYDDSNLAEEEGVVEEIVDEPIHEEIEEEVIVEEVFEEPIEEPIEEEVVIEENFSDSDVEAEKDDGLEDKYSKYDFDDDFDDVEESRPKPEFKKSVDLSKFEEQPLTEEELAEKERKARELEEKKRRIIEGTNFDNSLRKQ